MLAIKRIHHIAIICSNYETSKKFYTEILGFNIVHETYRKERNSMKLDLSLNNQYCIELFSFENPPNRQSRPESTGLRHLAFEVQNLDESIVALEKNGIVVEPIRMDAITNKRFTFFKDPDQLPLELYEVKY